MRVPVLFLLLVMVFSATLQAAEGRNRIVAVVNSEVITSKDVDQAMGPLYAQFQSEYAPEEMASRLEEAEQQIIQLLIEEKLMLQEAEDPRSFEVGQGRMATPPKIIVTETEILDAIAEIRKRFDTEEEFLEMLREQGMTTEDLKVRYHNQIIAQKLLSREVRSRISVAPSEVSRYYEQHQDQFSRSESLKVSNILIRVTKQRNARSAKQTANDVLERLKAGEGFSDLARRFSDGPNAPGGGQMGWVERGKFMPELEGALFQLKPGQLSKVIKSPIGFHIFQVKDERPARTASLLEVQDEIEKRLYREKYNKRYREWMGALKERAYITIK